MSLTMNDPACVDEELLNNQKCKSFTILHYAQRGCVFGALDNSKLSKFAESLFPVMVGKPERAHLNSHISGLVCRAGRQEKQTMKHGHTGKLSKFYLESL